MSVISRAVTAAAPAASAAKNVVADDITKYGAIAVAVLTVVGNAIPGFGLSGNWQAVIDAVIGVLTALSAVNKQKAVASALSAKALKSARKAAK